MLLLINANRMQPPIAPIGLDYLAAYLRVRGERVEVLDLTWAAEGCLGEVAGGEGEAGQIASALAAAWPGNEPELVGISFRNVDDCFWPSAAWFVPQLVDLVRQIRLRTAAPIVLGGVGYSIFPGELLRVSGADYGIVGDGEQALASLWQHVRGKGTRERVPGLVWRAGDALRRNPPAWPRQLETPPQREAFDNGAYFSRGGQIGVETKRGCPRLCSYCVDPLIKGRGARLRDPRTVAAEFSTLAAQGVDTIHLCDAEFNLPIRHAREVCDALIAGGWGQRMRWYAYLAVVPFDEDLARRMARAGCVGINFTSDSADPGMLAAYGHPHGREDLRAAVRLCHRYGLRVMYDLLLGGPGETRASVSDSIAFFRGVGADAVGAALGMRLYPGTALTNCILGVFPPPEGIRRHYGGPIDLVRPTFYIAPELGEQPAAWVRELIAADSRFFGPEDGLREAGSGSDHNYHASPALIEAIAQGARGAYWHILAALQQGMPLPGREG